MKHDRLSILRAQEAARLNDEKANAFYTEATGRSTRFRDDPAYAQSVLAFEARQTLPTPSKTAAPAASAEKRSFLVGDRVRVVDARGRANFLKEGMELVVTAIGPVMRGERTISVDERCRYFHKEGRFELMEAAGSTAPKAEEPKYWVCVKAYGKHGWQVGEVRHIEPSDAFKDCWFPCDKDGWVTHDPQPDSTCPVPDGVKPEAKCRCGTPEPHPSPNSWQLGVPGDRRPSMFDIVAWRPVKS